MARPKLGESDTERLHMKITGAELAAIDDWRYENRVPSRSEAVRRLCQIGLTTDFYADHLNGAMHEIIALTATMRKYAEMYKADPKEKIDAAEYMELTVSVVQASLLLVGEVNQLMMTSGIMKDGGDLDELLGLIEEFRVDLRPDDMKKREPEE